ncbi:DNA repair protein Rad51 [Musa troglodytarum]|uniref:DNA repair protein Rad51 n=1 Tax=Musa troglodytarum TaxID=320322 RepID=A0A9E7G4C5_9LILI|nr:DNA repair protein Rad51 [Musa troglodytarum]
MTKAARLSRVVRCRLPGCYLGGLELHLVQGKQIVVLCKMHRMHTYKQAKKTTSIVRVMSKEPHPVAHHQARNRAIG